MGDLSTAGSPLRESGADFASPAQRDFAYRDSKGKERPAPQLPAGVRVADTHCHLDMLDEPGYAIARAAYRGFEFLLNITDPTESASAAYAAVDSWLASAREFLDRGGEAMVALPQLRMACGVHPHNARDYAAAEPTLLDLVKDPRTSCIGEIGLDYHYDLSPRDIQRDVFARQLQLAHETGLPVALHIREAHDEALEILKREGCPAGGVLLHCFNLDAATLTAFLALDCHVAFGGPLTFKKSFETRAACIGVPLNRLLTETDAPYMAPEPLRGTECTPDQAAYTLRMLLDCFGYAGDDRTIALMTPRAVDMAPGEDPRPLVEPEFVRIQGGLSEDAFCERLFKNAVDLLDRAPTDWQEE